MRFGLTPSIGQTNGVRSQNEGRLTIGTISTRPCTSRGSSSCASLTAARIETYSQPWIPAMMVASGPSWWPLIVTYGHDQPSRTGRSEVSVPACRCPAPGITSSVVAIRDPPSFRALPNLPIGRVQHTNAGDDARQQ